MRVAVWKEGEWLPSKAGEGLNKRVVFKGIDDNHKTYYLNMTDYEFDSGAKQSIKDKWESICKEGNVLDVQIFSGTTINKFGQFTIIRDILKEKQDASK
jgi:hypothetical protein